MNNKTQVIKKFFEKLIIVGSELSSKNYIIIVLSSEINNQKKKYPFMDYITLGDEIKIDKKIESESVENIATPLNNIYNNIFVDLTRKKFYEVTDESTIKQFKELGLKI